MFKNSNILQWSDGNSDDWTYNLNTEDYSLVIFELTKVPNFSEPRFFELGGNLEERRSEIARRQLHMLRQLHALGPDTSLSLRLCKDKEKIRLFTIFRINNQNDDQIDQIANQISGIFPKEYNLNRITDHDSERWKRATDLQHVKFIDTLLKPEERHAANTWPYFYVPSLWQSQATNDLESLCRSISRFDGDVMVDITAIPAEFGNNERTWVDQSIKIMRQALNGERLINREDGRVLKTFDPMPGLRDPVENFEDLIKRYDRNRIFLYSFRVLASHEPFSVTQALIAGSSRSRANIINHISGQGNFDDELNAVLSVSINPIVRSKWWNEINDIPYRAQRLHRIVDIDEIASFWRLPIPVRAEYPGFDLDIGTIGDSIESESDQYVINLGTIKDDATKKESEATFNGQGLAKHGLVVGVPGSGKTTTVFNLLNQIWEQKIPFIVLEPAKTEYRALKSLTNFSDDMLVFTLGDERTSPFRYNPFEVPNGIPVESHISKLNACFMGAFNLFDPLPLLLDKAIRQTYEVNGWYDDSIGGESGLTTPTLSDLCQEAEKVIHSSGYSDKLRDDFNAALLQRLESLRRGSKGRMLDTKNSISFDMLMSRPIVLELDSLNEDEKALIMMFILTFVYEYAKANRRSGSPLRHVLIVEEAHNLIGRGEGSSSEFRANPKEVAIRMFTRMLAEMRALGQGILIADQLPTALAPEAVKQTNIKILMRMTARDDREEIGNTMDLDEAALKSVTRFKSGQALVYLEEWDRVRQIQTPNFKREYQVEEPPSDLSLSIDMAHFEEEKPEMYMPFLECSIGCEKCNRRVRSQAERLVQPLTVRGTKNIMYSVLDNEPLYSTVCRAFKAKILKGAVDIKVQYSQVNNKLLFCSYVHFIHLAQDAIQACMREQAECECNKELMHKNWLEEMVNLGQKIQNIE